MASHAHKKGQGLSKPWGSIEPDELFAMTELKINMNMLFAQLLSTSITNPKNPGYTVNDKVSRVLREYPQNISLRYDTGFYLYRVKSDFVGNINLIIEKSTYYPNSDNPKRLVNKKFKYKYQNNDETFRYQCFVNTGLVDIFNEIAGIIEEYEGLVDDFYEDVQNSPKTINQLEYEYTINQICEKMKHDYKEQQLAKAELKNAEDAMLDVPDDVMVEIQAKEEAEYNSINEFDARNNDKKVHTQQYDNVAETNTAMSYIRQNDEERKYY